MATFSTTRAAIESLSRLDLEIGRNVDRLRRVFLAARRADSPHQSLGKYAADGTGDQKRFHSHIEQTRRGRYRVVGVQCAEHQMARK